MLKNYSNRNTEKNKPKLNKKKLAYIYYLLQALMENLILYMTFQQYIYHSLM